MRSAAPLSLSATERRELTRWARGSHGSARLATRARIVLAAAEGSPNSAIARRLGIAPETAARWRERFRAMGVEGLRREAPRGGSPVRVDRELVEQVLRATIHAGSPGPAKWTTRTLARALRTSHMTVHRIWRAYGLANLRPGRSGEGPRRTRVDLVGVLRTPGVSAVVFGLEGPASPRPLSVRPVRLPAETDPGRAATDLLAALRASGPRGLTLTDPGPRSTSLLVFLRSIEKRTPPSTRLDAILDRPVASLGPRVDSWLDAHPRYRVYSTGGTEEWMRSAEAWFRRWENVPLHPESFRHLREYHRAWLPGTAPGGRAPGEGSWTVGPSPTGGPPGRSRRNTDK